MSLISVVYSNQGSHFHSPARSDENSRAQAGRLAGIALALFSEALARARCGNGVPAPFATFRKYLGKCL